MEFSWVETLADCELDHLWWSWSDTNEDWGISYAGEGWACDGPHPFSP